MIKHTTTLAAGMLLCALARAHDGHGMEGIHWHATDTLGMLVLGALAAAALWAGRR